VASADAPLGDAGELARVQHGVQRHQRPGRRDRPRHRVVHEDQVVVGGDLVDGLVVELRQRPGVPLQPHVRPHAAIGLCDRRHRPDAPGVVPAQASEPHGHGAK
jgi:hypothetical protein